MTAESELVTIAARAEALVRRTIEGVAKLAALSRVSARILREAIAQVANILQELLAAATRWANRHVPRLYGGAVSAAIAALGVSLSREATRSLLERQRSVAEGLTRTLLSDLSDAASNVLADSRRTLAGMTERTEGQRAFGFIDKRGRRWSLASYARMLARTHGRNITNAAILRTAALLGSQRVEVEDNEGPNSCAECRRANGKTWPISYAAANLIAHPNCVRRFRPARAA